MKLLDIQPYDEDSYPKPDIAGYPKFLQRVSPEWVTPLHDFSVGDTWYKWFKLARQFDELDLVECGKPCEPPPAWKDEEQDWRSLLEDTEEVRLHSDWETWGLKQGVCPGQPFLVEFAAPHVYGGGYYEPYDVEVEYSVMIVRRMPRSRQEAVRAWEKHRLAEEVAVQRDMRRIARRDQLCRTQTHKWWLEFNPWSLDLHTKYHLGDREVRHTLVTVTLSHNDGRRSDAEQLDAFKRLVRIFVRRYPDTSIGPLLDLAQSLEVPMDRYTRITLELLQTGQDHSKGRPVNELPL